MPTDFAEAQMYPCVSHGQAFLAAIGARRNFLYEIKMVALRRHFLTPCLFFFDFLGSYGFRKPEHFIYKNLCALLIRRIVWISILIETILDT